MSRFPVTAALTLCGLFTAFTHTAIAGEGVLSGSNYVYGIEKSNVCINRQTHTKLSLKLISFIGSKKVSLFKKQTKISFLASSTVVGSGTQSPTIPSSYSVTVKQYDKGQLQIPVHLAPVLINLDLSPKSSSVERVNVDYKLIKEMKGTVFGTFFNSLVEATGQVAGDVFTLGTTNFGTLAVNTFKAFYGETKDDDKARSDGGLNLYIPDSKGQCDQTSAHTGLLLHVFPPDNTGPGFIPVDSFNGYCFDTLGGTPTFDTVYWHRADDGSCGEMPADRIKLLNAHLAFLVTASQKLPIPEAHIMSGDKERWQPSVDPALKADQEMMLNFCKRLNEPLGTCL